MVANETVFAAGVSVSFLLVCLAALLLLPPYEGFDETAHYSYVSFLADRGAIPNFQSTPLDANIETEGQGLPRPYRAVPPYEANGGITYRDFFHSRSAQERDQAIRRLWQPPAEPAVYALGTEPNWQGQHPPLYYVLLVLPYTLSQDWSPGMRLFLLRLVSVLIACGSLFFWIHSIRLLTSPQARQLLLMAGLTVTFLPSLSYEFGRLGNDALVACLFSGVFYFLLSTTVHSQHRLRDFWGLGVMLGAGLLTKLFFLPIWLGSLVYTVWQGWRMKIGIQAAFLRLALLTTLPLVLSSLWFASFAARYGTPFGARGLSLQTGTVLPLLLVLLILLVLGYRLWPRWRQHAGNRPFLMWGIVALGLFFLVGSVCLGLFSSTLSPALQPQDPRSSSPPAEGLAATQFLFFSMLRAAGGFLTTFLWCGTWSWVRPSYPLYLLCLPFLLLTLYGCLSFFSQQTQHNQHGQSEQPSLSQGQSVVTLALFCLGPFLLGITYSIYFSVTASAYSYLPPAPGYYLFALWPAVGIVGALSFEPARTCGPPHTAQLRMVTLCGFVLLLFFEATGWWRSALVFSGEIYKVGTLQTGVGFLFPTPEHIGLVIDRLHGLVFPRAAFIVYTVAFALRLALVSWLIFGLLPGAWQQRQSQSRTAG